MIWRGLLFSFPLFSLSLLLIGCIPKRDVDANRPKPYYGPTLPMVEVVAGINANNARLPTLRASISELEANFVDDKGRRHTEILGGTLLYRSPRDVLVTGTKAGLGRMLTIGSNQDHYWFETRKPDPGTAWWGRYKFLGAECAEPIPIRPDAVLEVLGVSTINPDFNQVPVPVMRFNHGADAYMFIWNARSPAADRWIATKEVWYDRTTFRPKAVILFDANGRVVLEAILSKHVPVEVANLPREQWPTVASEYRLHFPESASRLRLTLEDVVLSRKGFPNDATFRFDPGGFGDAKVIQLDEACGP